jgi:hypothetical protein
MTIPPLHFMQGSGPMPEAWNKNLAALRDAGRITVSAPLQARRTATGTHLSLARIAGQPLAIGRVRVVDSSASEPTPRWTELVYAVELEDEGIGLPALGTDPESESYRILPNLARDGDELRVRPARPGSVGVAYSFWFEAEADGVPVTVTRRLVWLFDEVVAFGEC